MVFKFYKNIKFKNVYFSTMTICAKMVLTTTCGLFLINYFENIFCCFVYDFEVKYKPAISS